MYVAPVISLTKLLLLFRWSSVANLLHRCPEVLLRETTPPRRHRQASDCPLRQPGSKAGSWELRKWPVRPQNGRGKRSMWQQPQAALRQRMPEPARMRMSDQPVTTKLKRPPLCNVSGFATPGRIKYSALVHSWKTVETSSIGKRRCSRRMKKRARD